MKKFTEELVGKFFINLIAVCLFFVGCYLLGEYPVVVLPLLGSLVVFIILEVLVRTHIVRRKKSNIILIAYFLLMPLFWWMGNKDQSVNVSTSAPIETPSSLEQQETTRPSRTALIWGCEDVLKENLKDPWSFREVDADVFNPAEYPDGKVVKVQYRAKNGFGAYELDSASCLSRTGKVEDFELSNEY